MKCSLCGGDLGLLGKLGRLLWYKCRHCGMLFSRKSKSKAYRT